MSCAPVAGSRQESLGACSLSKVFEGKKVKLHPYCSHNGNRQISGEKLHTPIRVSNLQLEIDSKLLPISRTEVESPARRTAPRKTTTGALRRVHKAITG